MRPPARAKKAGHQRQCLRVELFESRTLPSVAIAPITPPVQVGTNSSAATYPDIGIASTGTYAGTFDVIYQQVSHSTKSIAVSRFNADGTPLASSLGPSTIPVDTVNISGTIAKIAVRPDGSFAVVYEQTTAPDNMAFIKSVFYNADGTIRRVLPMIGAPTAYHEIISTISVAEQDVTGNIAVVWAITQYEFSHVSHILLQRFDANGNAILPSPIAVTDSSAGEANVNPAVAFGPPAMGAGGIDMVVVYGHIAMPGMASAPEDVSYVRYNSAGIRLDPTAVKANATGTIAELPTVAMDAAGDFVIVWQDSSDPANSVVRMHRFSSAGVSQSPSNSDEAVDGGRAPSVARASDGRFIVAFQTAEMLGPPGTETPLVQVVVFRQFAKDGSPVGKVRTFATEAFDAVAAASGSGIFGIVAGHGTGSLAQAFQELASAFFAVGAAPNQVFVYPVSNGTQVGSIITPFANYSGGVSVAWGDVNADGFPDLIVTATSGNAAIKVYDGAALRNNSAFFTNPDQFLLGQGFVYGLAFGVGAYVAAGDVNNDGFADIVTGASMGNPHIKVFSGQLLSPTSRHTFAPDNSDTALVGQGLAYGLNFNVGATVAVADFEGNGFADIITGATVGNPHVKVYRGAQVIRNGIAQPFQPDNADPSLLLTALFAFNQNANIGTYVSAGDVDGDGIPDLIIGASRGEPEVHVYRGRDLRNGTFQSLTPNASLVDSFFALERGNNLGVSVGAADFTSSGRADILTGVGSFSPSVPADLVARFRVFKTNSDNTHTMVLPGFDDSIPSTQGTVLVAVEEPLNSRF